MDRRYLFLVSYKYAFPVFRPLQNAIRQCGGQCAWFFDEPGNEKFLEEGERLFTSVDEVIRFDPHAVFSVNHHCYHFLPGVKVQLFHGFYDKRGRGSHYRIRGWFDLYCTQGPSNTSVFEGIARQMGNFKVVETGWPKMDNFFDPALRPSSQQLFADSNKPVVLYATTFTEGLTSAGELYDTISLLADHDKWNWILTFHPKSDPSIVSKYRELESRKNVVVYDGDDNTGILERADVMLCDNSSIMFEFLLLDKPVVTFRNTDPGNYLINITDPLLLAASLEQALVRPAGLMENIRKRAATLDPYRDGRSSLRVLSAVEDYIEGRLGAVKPKKISVLRRFKARKKLKYWK